MTDQWAPIPQEPRRVPVPTLGEHALLLACLAAYGQHVRRLPPADARAVGTEAFTAHAGDDWRGEKTLTRILATYDRLHYRRQST